jgi:hypothetical protein
MRKYRAYISLGATLLLAYLLDVGLTFIKTRGVETFLLTPYFWASLVANFILACSLLGLFWLTAFRNKLSKTTSIVFIVAGLLLALVPVLSISVPAITLPRFLVRLSDPGTRLSLASVFIAVMGIFGLTLKDLKR